MGVKVITPPVVPPTVELLTEDLRAHCHVDGADQDALLEGFLAAAHQYCEHETGRAIGAQTLELALDVFPDGAIALPVGPVTSITSITYVDPDGLTQVLSAALYTLDDYGLQCWALPAFGTTWPATQDVANAVKVQYLTGSLTAAAKSAMLLIVGHLFEHRSENSEMALQSIPLGVKALLGTIKVWSR